MDRWDLKVRSGQDHRWGHSARWGRKVRSVPDRRSGREDRWGPKDPVGR